MQTYMVEAPFELLILLGIYQSQGVHGIICPELYAVYCEFFF